MRGIESQLRVSVRFSSLRSLIPPAVPSACSTAPLIACLCVVVAECLCVNCFSGFLTIDLILLLSRRPRIPSISRPHTLSSRLYTFTFICVPSTSTPWVVRFLSNCSLTPTARSHQLRPPRILHSRPTPPYSPSHAPHSFYRAPPGSDADASASLGARPPPAARRRRPRRRRRVAAEPCGRVRPPV